MKSFFRRLLERVAGRRAGEVGSEAEPSGVADAPTVQPPVSKEEQIAALLSGGAQALMARLLGDAWTARSYEEVFTVSRRDVEEYVARRGVPREAFVGSDGEAGIDGWMHCIREGNRWHVYWLERGSRDMEQVFEDEGAAMQALAYELARRSGTGIVARWEGD